MELSELKGLKRRLFLNFILSKIFGEDDLKEELEKITGIPEPQSSIQKMESKISTMPDNRFQALRAKLKQNESEPEVREDAETGRTE